VNVLVLMAGSDTRFAEAGYTFPKNLVEVDSLSLAEHVVKNTASLRGLGKVRFLFAVRREENDRHHTGAMLQLLVPDAVLLSVPALTAGAACTALLAVEHVDNDDPLLIANGDVIVDADLAAVVSEFQRRDLDGGIIVFRSAHPRWSHVRCNAEGFVVEAAEKRPISDLATVGLYYFRRGRDFVRAAKESIRKDAHVNNAFFVCPCYNELVLDQKKIGIHEIPTVAYHSLATPEGLQAYGEFLRGHRGAA
jgi:dTDP-glucose pyrophosphorylase